MSTFKKIEAIIERIEAYHFALDPKADAEFYELFAAPKSIDYFVTFVECLLDQEQPAENAKREQMVRILVDCIHTKENLQDLLFSTVKASAESGPSHDPALQAKLVNILVSLPELVSNLCGLACPEKLSPQTYTTRLCTALRHVLTRVHAELGSLDSLSHFNLIVGRLCLKGYAPIVWDNLLKDPSTYLLADLKWLQISRRILLPDSSTHAATAFMFMEPVTKMLFLYASCCRIVHNLFKWEYLKMINGNSSLLSKLEFLLTNKFLLIHHHSPSDTGVCHPDQFLWNILTYLCGDQQRQWLSTAINNLLDTWSNSSAYKFRSYYQHFYLCRVLIITTKVLFEDKAQQKIAADSINKFRSVIFCGAEMHLKSSQLELRALGLTTTAIVMDILAKFCSINIVAPELEEAKITCKEDCDYLKELTKVDVRQMFEAEPVKEDPVAGAAKEQQKPKPIEQSKPINSTVSEQQQSISTAIKSKPKAPLDSDDDDDGDDEEDLKPYDLSNDVQVEDDIRFVGKDIEAIRHTDVQTALLIDNSRKAPVYLQDCMEGLSQNEKPFWTEKCLQCAEKIIRANFAPSAGKSLAANPLEYGRLNTVALSFAKILFALDNQFSLDNFDQLRLNALVALCVGAPRIVAKYISEQFYAPYHSIRHRLDALSILTTASEELSQTPASDEVALNSPSEGRRFLKDTTQAVARFEQKYFGIAYSEEDSDDDDVSDGKRDRDWRQVVSERIRANTRYISPAYMRKHFEATSTSGTTTSRFVPVAGHFFFPLLRDPNKVDIALRLHDEDAFVLEHLFYSLGFMLQNCANYPSEMQMAKELLHFMSAFRGHEISNVRLAMVMAFQSILQSTPTFYLFDELLISLLEFQLWLQEIALHDVDRKCVVAASQTLGLLVKLKQNADNEGHLKSVDRKPGTVSQSEQLVQSTASLQLDSTIRVIKQTRLL